MPNPKIERCPLCQQSMEQGFSVRNVGLSWVTPEKMRQFVSLDKDLNENGIKKYFPAKAQYDLSYHCPNCKIYIVDYSTALSSAQAKELAKSM